MMNADDLQEALKTKDFKRIRILLREQKEPALEDFRNGRIGGRELNSRLSAIIDRQISAFAAHYLGDFKDLIAVVFTGGNGRQEVYPYSDLDLMTLIPEEMPAGFEDAYMAFYNAVTDAGFIKPGLAVRSVKDCREQALQDHTVWTSLLDRRYIWGHEALFDVLSQTLKHLYDSKSEALLTEKIAERGVRLGRMADSRYMLHPNIKEGRGGLRDYQTVLWIAQLVFDCRDMMCFLDRSLLSPKEKDRIEAAYEFLSTARSHMHDLRGGAYDLLDAEILPELVERYNKSRPHETRETVESFMRTYFRHTREIGFFANIISAAVQDRKRWFDDSAAADNGFLITAGHVRFDSDSPPVKDLMRIFRTAAERGCRLDYTALRIIREKAAAIDEQDRRDAQTNRIFMDVLSNGEHAAGLLRQMQETGLLQKFIPAFAHIDMLMQFDPYHEYTVDEHSFQCIQKLHELKSGELDDEAPLAAALIKRLAPDARRLLQTAMLFHDLGKGYGGVHEEIGAKFADELCPRLGFDDAQTNMISWLVRYHLVFAHTAFHFDVDDPETVAQFCKRIPDESHLDLLAILTTADIMGVGPKRWNWNKAASLQQLYDNAKLYLAEKELKQAPEAQLPPGYTAGETHITIENDPQRAVTIVTVTTPDTDRLFEKLTAAFGLLGSNIIDAAIETAGSPPTAIDRFVIRSSGDIPYEEYDFDRIRKKITALLDPSYDRDPGAELAALSARHNRKYNPYGVKPVIKFNNAASAQNTVLEIEARDRPALLYSLSRAFNETGLDLRRAKITLYGHKAIDTFYLRDRKTGGKIAPERFDAIAAAIGDLSLTAAP